MSKVNTIIYRLILYLFNNWLTYLPFHLIRNFFIKILVKEVGINCSFLMGLKLRNPRNIIIGDNVVTNRDVMLDGRGAILKIGNNSDIAQETNVWTLEHDVNDDYHSSSGGEVIIEDNVWVASRVTILPGVLIGSGAVVAACAVVSKNVKSMSIVAGVPARKIGTRNSKLLYKNFHRPYFE